MENKQNQKLIAHNSKLKTPSLRFAGFCSGWEEKRLKELLQVLDGDRGVNYPKSINFSKEGYCLFLNAKNVTKRGFLFEENSFITKEKDEQMRKGKLQRNDIVLTTRGSVGHIAFYNNEIPFNNIRINSGMVLLRGNQKNIDSKFLYRFLDSKKIQNRIQRVSFGSAQPQLTVKEINNLKISFPLFPEQQKIAEFLGAVDEWIENLRAQKENLEFYKKGMMQKIFSQEVRFKDDNGKNFPKWEEKRLGDVCEKKSSSVSANSLDNNSGKYKIYGASGFFKKVNFYKEEEPYISIVKDGAGVGRLLLCDSKTSVLGTLDIIKPKKNVNLYFVYLLIHKINFIKYVTGATIPHIYFKDYKKEKIQIPSIEEQQKIANFLTSIDNLINSKQQQITQAEEWKKGLMQGLFV